MTGLMYAPVEMTGVVYAVVEMMHLGQGMRTAGSLRE